MIHKIWAALLAVITGLAVALKVSTNKTKTVKKELETEKFNREVDQEKHNAESEIILEQQKIVEEAPKATYRSERPTGSFGDPRMQQNGTKNDNS